MKKKLSWIILAVVLIVFTCVYSVVDKNNGIYDRTVDTSEYVAIALEKDESLRQTFISKENYLDGISIKMSVSGQAKDKAISYTLKDKENNVVASGETSLEKMKAGKFFKLKFDRLEKCKGQEYTFEMTVKECDQNNQVIVYAVPGEDKGAELYIKNEKTDGVMVFRTITHRFDIETFVVTAIFMLYVVAFVGWLSKVFK